MSRKRHSGGFCSGPRGRWRSFYSRIGGKGWFRKWWKEVMAAEENLLPGGATQTLTASARFSGALRRLAATNRERISGQTSGLFAPLRDFLLPFVPFCLLSKWSKHR